MVIDNEVLLFNTVEDFITELKKINANNIYKITLKTDFYMFKSAVVEVSYLKEEEINKPIKVVKIARNINAFDNSYVYSDDSSVYDFWNNLKNKIEKLINTLSKKEATILKQLVNSENQKNFSIC